MATRSDYMKSMTEMLVFTVSAKEFRIDGDPNIRVSSALVHFTCLHALVRITQDEDAQREREQRALNGSRCSVLSYYTLTS